MKKIIIACIVFTLGVAGVAFLSWYWIRWGPRPDINVQGQVIDRANGHGVADAYVILALETYSNSYAGSYKGCAEGSAVVRTDEDGKFTYSIAAREAFGPKNPSAWSVRMYVYHHEFDAALRTDLPEKTTQRLAANRTSDGGWQERPDEAYMTFPLFFHEEDGPEKIEVVKRSGSEWQQIEYFASSPRNKCIKAPVDRGHSQLLTELQTRTWSLFCLENAGTGSNPSPDTMQVIGLFTLLEQTYFSATRKSMGYAGVQQFASELYTRLINSVLADYPWDEKSPEFNRDMTERERAAFCQFHTPPVEDVVNRSLSK